ncbi:GIY-YIG nuclease family protein [Methylocystis sp. S23]|jgi:putative endonuclease
MLVDGASVYILLCADGSYYTGLTRNEVETRVSEHNLGINANYTSNRRPVILVWSEHFERLTDAIAMERQLKGWSRAKKAALISGDHGALPTLAARRNKKNGAPSG